MVTLLLATPLSLAIMFLPTKPLLKFVTIAFEVETNVRTTILPIIGT
jgi:hypothetical protein